MRIRTLVLLLALSPLLAAAPRPYTLEEFLAYVKSADAEETSERYDRLVRAKDWDGVADVMQELARNSQDHPLRTQFFLDDLIVAVRDEVPSPKLRETVTGLAHYQDPAVLAGGASRSGPSAIAQAADRTIKHWEVRARSDDALARLATQPEILGTLNDEALQRTVMRATLAQLAGARPGAERLPSWGLVLMAHRLADAELYRALFKRPADPGVLWGLNLASASAAASYSRGLMPPEVAWEVLSEAAGNPTLRDAALQARRSVYVRQDELVACLGDEARARACIRILGADTNALLNLEVFVRKGHDDRVTYNALLVFRDATERPQWARDTLRSYARDTRMPTRLRREVEGWLAR